jgi:hypothetical protein|tara:strand:+ start:169 stop:783 length:615 start_codon:yes stop_codon:yes gene_type:complete
MADRAQGAVSFTPIVTIDADSDADAVDAIHHNIKGALGGDLTYTKTDANDKWYYAPNVIVTASSTVLISQTADDYTVLVGATGDPASPNEAAGSEAHFTETGNIDAGTDDVKFLFIKNTGTSDTDNTVTTNSVYLTLDAGTAAHSTEDAIEIAAGEAWMGRVNNIVDDFRIISAQANAANTAATVNGSQLVRCTVVALIDDGGH